MRSSMMTSCSTFLPRGAFSERLRGAFDMGFVLKVRCMAALGILLALGSRAEEIGEYQVKAAFLCNFAKFVEWPAQTFKTPDEPIVICVLGRNPFGNALEAAAGKMLVDGRTLSVRYVSKILPEYNCRILFVSELERRCFRPMAASIK